MIVRGFVQAGGGSTRFGSDKGLAQFAGKSMLVRTAELVASVCEDVHLVAPAGRYADLGWPALVDRWPSQGPLGGILTALHHINAVAPPNGTSAAANGPGSLALIVSCDMPFLTQEFLAFLRERALASPAQVVVPQSSTGLEPLCACWRFSAVDAVQSAFDSGVRKVTEAMKRLPMEVLDELLWKRFDKGNRLFRNMNTPQDYAEARRIFEASEP